MNILPIIAFIGASVLAVEGMNVITGGEVYTASLERLAQESSLPPMPPTDQLQQNEPLPPQPPSDQQQPPPQDQKQLPPQEQQNQQFPPGPQQEFQQQPPQPLEEFEEERGEFVDPREIRDAMREIRQLKSELKRFVTQLKRLANNADDLARINEILSQLNGFYAVLSNNSADASELRDAIDEFRGNQYWDEMNKIRAKVELPREIKQISTTLKRIEKTIKLKTMQNIGLDLTKVRQTIGEMKQNLQTVQEQYQSGNLEEAMDTMQYFHEGGHPGEIEGTIFRIRDIKQRMKQVKDQSVRSEVNNVLQEVIDTFNAGEYRDARETLDEYADDIMQLIDKFIRSQTKRGFDKQDSVSKIKNLDGLIKGKLQGKE